MDKIEDKKIEKPNKKLPSDAKAELGKKPFWYLFLLANVIVVLGCAITFTLMYKDHTGSNKTLFYLPTLICNILAVIPAGFFIWLELRDISPKMMHFQRKWLKFYIIAASFFIAAIIFSTLFFVICASKPEYIAPNPKKWVWIIYLVITIVLTLVAIAFQRYARYRIDLDVYRRKHGEEIKQQEDLAKEQVKAEETKPVEVKDSDVKTPTSGIIDQMDK